MKDQSDHGILLCPSIQSVVQGVGRCNGCLIYDVSALSCQQLQLDMSWWSQTLSKIPKSDLNLLKVHFEKIVRRIVKLALVLLESTRIGTDRAPYQVFWIIIAIFVG